MKLIKPYVEFIDPIDRNAILQKIERAARTCYKSEDKITPDSAAKMVAALVRSNHTAMLEHSSLTVKFITDRAIANEIVRHRIASFAQESTRYVSSNDKTLMEPETEEDIIAAYHYGLSMKKIAQLCECKEWDIYKILTTNNIEKRGHNAKGNTNHEIFSVIDSSEKAYLLGIIQTDGSLRGQGSKGFSITQHKDYYWYIELMMKELINHFPVVNQDKNCYQMSITSEKIWQDLYAKGIVPNKSRVQTEDDIEVLWNSIPEEYIYDFVRGVLDGDGCIRFFKQKETSISYSANMTFSGNIYLLRKIQQLILDDFGYKGGLREEREDIHFGRLGFYDYSFVKSVCEMMYQHFRYPFGHPKKVGRIIEQIGGEYPTAVVGDPNFCIVCPTNIDTNPWTYMIWLRAMYQAEEHYFQLRLNGCTAQEARSVLPLCLKTEIVMTANLREWMHFLNLRSKGITGAPHPDMKVVADMVYEKFHAELPEIFE